MAMGRRGCGAAGGGDGAQCAYPVLAAAPHRMGTTVSRCAVALRRSAAAGPHDEGVSMALRGPGWRAAAGGPRCGRAGRRAAAADGPGAGYAGIRHQLRRAFFSYCAAHLDGIGPIADWSVPDVPTDCPAGIAKAWDRHPQSPRQISWLAYDPWPWGCRDPQKSRARPSRAEFSRRSCHPPRQRLPTRP